MDATASAGHELTEAVQTVCRLKLDTGAPLGWSPLMRQRFGYFTPDEWYEATLLRLVENGTTWLDVGCGHDLFPTNEPLARLLASRASKLVGLDPSDNIDRNTFVHERAKCLLEEYESNQTFDVISLRMVAEHIREPESAVAVLGRLTRSGGRVVVYTVSKWSPASLLAAVTPMAMHHAVKRILWDGLPEDTFPTVYHMNTRKQLQRLFKAEGFVEESFLYLDDCRALARWRLTSMIELWTQRALRAVGLHFPDVCLLGTYRKLDIRNPA